jgi:3-(3-hydroxy-phenyl)propionate hydroxylase
MELTFSEYFPYVHHEPALPPLTDGQDARRHPVVVAGGGPTGLAVALGLANHGVPSVVLEADDTVCSGSRAGAITRRTLEIFERLGVIEPVLRKGFAWGTGVTYLRDREVLRFQMPDDRDQKFPPGMSLQQNYVEQYLLDEIERRGALIDVRWQSSVRSVRPAEDGVSLTVRTPLGDYGMAADWLVACDGGRSTVRRELGLNMTGTAYEGRYVIIDIRIDTEGFPIGRRCWFDPPSNPGGTLLMYTKPDQMVRFDYQLRDDEDADEALKPENALPRVAQHLDMMGVRRDWEPVWMSLYRANALSLERYRHGRVLFAGDAAHLVPIFGVRGMNSSLDDAHNLAWKLALRVTGRAPDALLESYSAERVYAARENLRFASKGAEFMGPPSAPFRLMRDAVLSLAESHPWITSLLNPRQHAAIPLVDSPLNLPDVGEFARGPRAGDILGECPLAGPGASEPDTHLTSLLGHGFTAYFFTEEGTVPDPLADEFADLAAGAIPARTVVISARPAAGRVHDSTGRFARLYDASPGTLYLVRPDGHVLGRWREIKPGELTSVLAWIGASGGQGGRA